MFTKIFERDTNEDTFQLTEDSPLENEITEINQRENVHCHK